MPLDFQITGADDGYNDEESIQPYENGEAAEETIFRRPPENLRNRTEVIRKAVDDAFLVNAADRGWLLVAAEGVQATWNGTVAGGGGGDGEWTISSGSLYLTPVISAGEQDVKNDIAARLAYKIATDVYFTVRSYHEGGAEIRAYNGANNLRLELFYVAGVTFPSDTPQISVEGSNDGGTYDPALGPVLIRVQLSHDTAIRSTWAQVVTELNADAVAGTFVRASVTAGSPGGDDYADVIDAQFLWEGVGADVSGTGAVDAQSVTITKAQIDNFFTSGGGSAGMADGDAIVVEFDTARDRLDAAGNATYGAALRLIHRNENDPPPTDADFSSVGTAFQGNSIPLCKVFDNELWFANGVVLKKDQTGYIRQNDAKLRAELASQTPTVGAALVGNDALSGTNYIHGAGTVDTHLSDIFGDVDGLKSEYDAHVAGSADLHHLKHILGHPWVTVGSAAAYDYTTLAGGVGSGNGLIAQLSNLSVAQSVNLSSNGAFFVGSGAYILVSSGTDPVLRITNAPSSEPVVFENMIFRASTDVPLVQIDDYEELAQVVFRNCYFRCHSSGTQPLIKNSGNVVFENCVFNGQNSTHPLIEISATDGAGLQRLVMRNCIASEFLQVLTCTGAELAMGKVEFHDSEFRLCVDSDAGTKRVMFDGDIGGNREFDTFIIERCTASGVGMFAEAEAKVGYGLIAYNTFEAKNLTFDCEQLPAIYVRARGSALDYEHRFRVLHNTLNLGDKLCGVLADGNAIIQGNNFLDFRNTSASLPSQMHYAIKIEDTDSGANAEVLDNVIEGKAGGLSFFSTSCIHANDQSEGVRISGNKMKVPEGYNGIWITDCSFIDVSHNDIIGIAATPYARYGIYLGTGTINFGTINGNRIREMRIGIRGDGGGGCVICGNFIRGPSSSGSEDGISLGDPLFTVTGNYVNRVRFGIHMDTNAYDCTLVGNNIQDPDVGIYIEHNQSITQDVVSSNRIESATTYGIQIANNIHCALVGNISNDAGTADIELPATSNNIGLGIPGSCVATYNHYTSLT